MICVRASLCHVKHFHPNICSRKTRNAVVQRFIIKDVCLICLSLLHFPFWSEMLHTSYSLLCFLWFTLLPPTVHLVALQSFQSHCCCFCLYFSVLQNDVRALRNMSYPFCTQKLWKLPKKLRTRGNRHVQFMQNTENSLFYEPFGKSASCFVLLCLVMFCCKVWWFCFYFCTALCFWLFS